MLSLKKSCMNMLFSEKLLLLFFEQEAHPTEHSLRLSAGGWKAEVFPWKLWPSWPPPIQGVLALVQNWLFSVPASKES